MRAYKYMVILFALPLMLLYTVGCQANESLQNPIQQELNDYPIEEVQADNQVEEPTEEDQTESNPEDEPTGEDQAGPTPEDVLNEEDHEENGEGADSSVAPDDPPTDNNLQVDPDPQKQPTERPVEEETVQPGAPPMITISIQGDAEKGSILEPTELMLESKDTVLDLLKRVTKQHKIQMEYQGRGMLAYVEGIDNLYELDHGSQSGWVYHVSGEAPTEGAGTYTPEEGDRIEWLYTLNLGDDVSDQE